jgi:hypothetical protein
MGFEMKVFIWEREMQKYVVPSMIVVVAILVGLAYIHVLYAF